jgi:hypothetical protein
MGHRVKRLTATTVTGHRLTSATVHALLTHND